MTRRPRSVVPCCGWSVTFRALPRRGRYTLDRYDAQTHVHGHPTMIRLSSRYPSIISYESVLKHSVQFLHNGLSAEDNARSLLDKFWARGQLVGWHQGSWPEPAELVSIAKTAAYTSVNITMSHNKVWAGFDIRNACTVYAIARR